jgi:hypothetical protein
MDEARMLIPGVTTFLGFQLIAVFNSGFGQLTGMEQLIHLGAMLLDIVALVLLLTPAEYHRAAESGWVSQGFVNMSTRLITTATPLFALSVTADFYLLVRVVTKDATLAALAALAVLAVVAAFWFVLPRSSAFARFLRRGSPPGF